MTMPKFLSRLMLNIFSLQMTVNPLLLVFLIACALAVGFLVGIGYETTITTTICKGNCCK